MPLFKRAPVPSTIEYITVVVYTFLLVYRLDLLPKPLIEVLLVRNFVLHLINRRLFIVYIFGAIFIEKVLRHKEQATYIPVVILRPQRFLCFFYGQICILSKSTQTRQPPSCRIINVFFKDILSFRLRSVVPCHVLGDTDLIKQPCRLISRIAFPSQSKTSFNINRLYFYSLFIQVRRHNPAVLQRTITEGFLRVIVVADNIIAIIIPVLAVKKSFDTALICRLFSCLFLQFRNQVIDSLITQLDVDNRRSRSPCVSIIDDIA